MNTHKPYMKGCVVILILLVSCSKPMPLPPPLENPQPQNQPQQPQPGIPQPPPGEPQPPPPPQPGEPQPQPGAPQPQPGEPQSQSGEPQPLPQPGVDTAPGGSQPQPQPNPTSGPGGGQTQPGASVFPTATSEWIILDYIDFAISGAKFYYESDYLNAWVLDVNVYDYSSTAAKYNGKIKCTGAITGTTGKITTFVKEGEIEKDHTNPGAILCFSWAVLQNENVLLNSLVECNLSQAEDMNSQNNTFTCTTASCSKEAACVCK